MTVLIITIIVVSTIIGSLITISNRIQLRKLEVDKERTEKEAEDEQLRHFYPTLYYELPDEVKDFHRGGIAYVDMLKKHSEHGIDSDDYPIVMNTQIMRKISKEFLQGDKKEEVSEKMINITKYSRKFFEKLQNDRKVTKKEVRLIAFLVWEYIDESISSREDIMEMEMETIESWHEEYEDLLLKK